MRALASRGRKRHITEYLQHLEMMNVVRTRRKYSGRYTKLYARDRASMRGFSTNIV